ncbi:MULTISPECIES: hypothetical protein [Shewanella]|uniref:Uncharacterized protein n=1 Tax=Shewanella marisflavi TaxID=260364 RepID=A0ABX5WMY1_9GAMM|nr:MULTISPECIES: hypothetical protein [Shewanella]QDF75933.1 hypothetical protein FGA12_12695 [Shewanella marisflavi]
MKSISDLVGQVKIAQRLNNTLAFKNIELAASNYESVMSRVGTVDWAKASVQDKKAVQKKIQNANENVLREMKSASNKLLSKLANQQDKFEQNAKPTHSDLALAGMLAGKAPNELFEIGCSSRSAARLLFGTDAGVFGGLSKEQIQTLAKHAAPDDFAEIQATEESINTLIRLKETLDGAHLANEMAFSVSDNDRKLAGILDDEPEQEGEEPAEAAEQAE